MISASVLKKKVADAKQEAIEYQRDLNQRILKVISFHMEEQAKYGKSSYIIPNTICLPAKESGWSPTSARLDIDKMGMILTALKDAGYRVEEKELSYTVYWD
jgi:hypothetical protein